MMQSFVRNHRFVIASIVLSLFLCSALIAEPARPEQVRTVANTFLKMRTAQSATGGWLETTWHQSEPYNDLCPLDPVDGRRCVVGCVAAAMAQLINYHQLCNVTFDESDTYSTYNGIDIDADSAYGGGIYNFFGVPSIINNTIAHNRPNGLDLDWVTDWFVEEPALVWNNIVWENEMYVWDEVYPDEYDLRYNDIQGGPKGEEEEGNIDVDPHFADPQNRDYHLKSEAGRWDPVTESWITDGVTSPCIDAGHPETEIGQESAPHGSRVNMGAYGGTGQASKSLE